MSRGGRAGGGGASTATGVRAIANVLGISRQEIGQFTSQQNRDEPLPLYPPLLKDPLPLEQSKELAFMTDAKQEFLHRFRESPFYRKRAGKRDVQRYTDKYRAMDKEPFEPQWERLPAELNWCSKGHSSVAKHSQRKRAKLEEMLDKLGRNEEATEKKTVNEEEIDGKAEDDDDEGEQRPKPVDEDDEEAEYSDEDYLMEGANDYVDTYFDDGEGYHDEEGNALEDEGIF